LLTGGIGKDTLTGGVGVDRFDYRNLADSAFNSFDVITDFNANAGNDLFVVATVRSAFNVSNASIPFDHYLGRWWLRLRTVHAMGDEFLSLDCPSSSATTTNQGLCLAQKALGRRTHFWVADGLSAISPRL
jgi:hypothetical protein